MYVYKTDIKYHLHSTDGSTKQDRPIRMLSLLSQIHTPCPDSHTKHNVSLPLRLSTADCLLCSLVQFTVLLDGVKCTVRLKKKECAAYLSITSQCWYNILINAYTVGTCTCRFHKYFLYFIMLLISPSAPHVQESYKEHDVVWCLGHKGAPSEDLQKPGAKGPVRGTMIQHNQSNTGCDAHHFSALLTLLSQYLIEML